MFTDFVSPQKPRRPPNGYNLFLRHQGSKAKQRDRVWGAYSKARRMKVNKLARIAKTGEIAGLWGGNAEMRERFEREAKELQELYRAQIDSWKAADRFIPYMNHLMSGKDELPAAAKSPATKASVAAAAAARTSAAAATPLVVPPRPSNGKPMGGVQRPTTEIIFMLL